MSELPRIQSFDEFERFAQPIVTPFRSQFQATWFHEAGNKRARREWLVKDLILARSFGVVYGPPGCGKSFLMADLMLTCAASALNRERSGEWFGYKVNAFGVVYLVAEGADDFIIRLHAWRMNNDIGPGTVLPFMFLPTSIDLRSDAADTKRLIEEIRGIDIEMRNRCGVGVGAVIVDTVSRALAGGNENDSAVMGGFVRNCETLQKETGAAVVGVHHGGKEAGRGPRGHEALLGAADFICEVMPRTDEEPTNRWAVRKLKAGPAGAEHHFTLRPMRVDEDDDGDDITSCVVISRDRPEPSEAERNKGYPASGGEIEFLRVLGDAIDRDGVVPPAGVPVARNVNLIVKTDIVKTIYRQTYEATEDGDEKQIDDRLRQRWSRATKSLIRNGVVGSKDGWLWFTGRKIRGAAVKGVAVSMAEAIREANSNLLDRDDYDPMEGI